MTRKDGQKFGGRAVSHRTALRFMYIVLIVWAAGVLPASSATRHVVLLFDERVELPGLAALEADFVQTLASNSADYIEIYRENMDIARFGSDSYRTLLKGYLREKYANKKIDVAVAIFGAAFDFLLKNGDAIFPGAPLVFCGIDRRELGDRSLPPHVRGVLLKREFAPTLEIALSLHPDTKRVTVVAGTSEFDTRLLDQARKQFGAYESRLAFTYLTTAPLKQLLANLAGLPPQTVVLFTTLFQDGAGESFVPHNVVPLVSAAASAPVYGFLDQFVGRGIVGGSLYSVSTQGMEAAKVVLQVLTNPEPAGPALLEVSGNKVLFDWRQMQRWGVSESSLPAGSEIQFRDATVWEQYRVSILGVVAAILLQTALITWLFYEHWRRQMAEAESLQRVHELARMNRFATAGELSASIAHEIRQPLASIASAGGAGLNWLKKTVPDLDEVRIALQKVVNESHRADDVIKSVRTMFRNESPICERVNLNELIQQVITSTARPISSNNIVLDTDLTAVPPFVMANPVQLQQVILNLVMNAVEALGQPGHWARVLRLTTQTGPAGMVLVRVVDTGPSTDPKVAEQMFQPFFTTKSGGMGMGLSICKTIIEAHGGSLTAVPSKPHGMEFRIVLPLARIS
jgi:signal transduction histidine kinase